MTELEQGVELWHSLSQQLNDIIKQQGEITIDDKRIWNGYLHKWTNEEWQLLLTAMCELHLHYPEMFKRFHTTNIEAALATLLRQGKEHPRALDRKVNKGKAWATIMTAVEVWNTACDINLVNQAQTRTTKPTTTFHNVFELRTGTRL